MKKTAVIYWSGTGNTEAMANAVLEGMKQAGADAALLSVDDVKADEVISFDAVAMGCPAMGAEVLEETEFEPLYQSIKDKLSGKPAALFGSYGWGDGEWMRNWEDDCKAAGVEKTVMLTGDVKKVADKVAADLGVDEVHSELLPADKVSMVEVLLAQKDGKAKLAFVGDGINDAPVLSRADIGIAMGAMGSDAAIEAADVVLMDDDPMKIAKAIKISRKCIRIVWQNIIFALGIKALCLVLGAAGIADMWAAIFADVGVMVLAVLNAIRALRVENL